MPDSPAKPNPRAELAFVDYVAMGSGRSLRALHEQYRQITSKPPAKSLDTLFDWSVRYRWQARLEQAATEQSESLLQEAAALDAETFLQSSRLLNERMKYATREHADAIVKMRESVRKPVPKGGAGVNVSVSLEVRTLAEKLAKELGDDAGELIREAEELARREWDRVG